MTVKIKFNGYTPAILESQAAIFNHYREFEKYCWWKENSEFFYYPALLVSAYYGMKYPNFREKFGIGKSVLLIGDSGGFQAWTKGEHLEPVEVLRWLERNCQVGMTLDIPPPYPSLQSVKLHFSDFKAVAKQSARNYQIMVNNRVNYDLKLLKVFHGVSWDELEFFYGLTKDIEADGWCLAPKPVGDPFSIAVQFAYLQDKGELERSYFHVLALSGFRNLPVIFYIKSKLSDSRITFDSSTWAVGNIYRRMLFPFSLESSSVELQIGSRPNRLLSVSSKNMEKFGDNLPCFCPVCSRFTLSDLIKDTYISGLIISLHNLYCILLYVQYLDFLSKDPELLKLWIEKNSPDRVLKAIEFIELSERVGFRNAYQQFKDYLKAFEPIKSKEVQTSLW